MFIVVTTVTSLPEFTSVEGANPPADGAFQLLCDGENGRFTTAAPDQLDAQGESAFGEPGGHSGRRVAADIPDRTVGGDRQRLADC